MLLPILLAGVITSQTTPAFRNPDLPVERRVTDLVNRLTIDEKCSQLLSVAPAVPRLGIAAYNWWSECLHGVTIKEDTHLATCFPQALGMAASWSIALLQQVASAIGDEARARHHHWRANDLSFYAPNINIVRDPRWGRAMETYGEDPYLTARLAVAFIRGLQGDHPTYLKALATAKHYAVHSGPDETRFGFNVSPTAWDLRQTYLPHFRAAVCEAGASQVMAAYNAVYGKPAAANPQLLTEILRGEWKFAGMVVSDCGGTDTIPTHFGFRPNRIETAAACLNAGLDMDLCGETFRSLRAAVDAGLTSEAAVSRACERVFTQRFRLGEFDPPQRVPYTQIPASVVGCAAHRQLALRMASESLILLKNDGQALPLLADQLKRVLVIGPNSDDRGVILSNYFWGKETALTTPLAALRERLKGKAEVTYIRGCDWLTAEVDVGPVPADAIPGGLSAEYYTSDNLTGDPVLKRQEKNIDYDWLGSWPLPGRKEKGFSARWSGRIRFPSSGKAKLVTRTDDGVRVFLDGKCILDDWIDHGAKSTLSTAIDVQAGRDYDLKVEYFDRGGSACAQLRWIPAIKADPFEPAIRAAADADVVLAFMGHKGFDFEPSTEGEGLDRRPEIPPVQESLLRAVHARAKKVVLIMLNGGPTGSVWAQENIPAILEAWYPGQEGGTAIVDALFGDTNPGGRMPVTVYRSDADLPPFEDYSMLGRTYRYMTCEPLYAFGYGLSYTTFAYSDLSITRSESATGAMPVAAFKVTNTGKRAGDEVVQAYLSPRQPLDRQPRRQLVGFQRVFLKPGESRQLEFRIDMQWCQPADLSGQPSSAGGPYVLCIGGSQPPSGNAVPQAGRFVAATLE